MIGSPGFIGTQTLDIVAENPDKFRVVGLTAGSNVTLLANQVKTFKPQLELKEALANMNQSLRLFLGKQGAIEVVRHPDAVSVVTGILGCAILKAFGGVQLSAFSTGLEDFVHQSS